MKKNQNLVIDGNAFYEIDRECMKKGLNQTEKKEKDIKKRTKNTQDCGCK